MTRLIEDRTDTLRQTLEKQLGVIRSLAIYYGVPGRIRLLTEFYRQFIRPGDLCFDIGAHVGNRIAAWMRLDAGIVAVEPQAHLMAWLRRFYGHSKGVSLVQSAVGASPGKATLRGNNRNPTVSTLSESWVAAVSRDDSFAGVFWDQTEVVDVTTLDSLIARFGLPTLIKIDVEGFELEVLRGLSAKIPVISFEYIPAAIELAEACLDRLADLGSYEFNWFAGESHRWVSPVWLDQADMRNHLKDIATGPASGDIFARLADGWANHRPIPNLPTT